MFAILASHAPRLPDCLGHVTRENRGTTMLQSMSGGLIGMGAMGVEGGDTLRRVADLGSSLHMGWLGIRRCSSPLNQ